MVPRPAETIKRQWRLRVKGGVGGLEVTPHVLVADIVSEKYGAHNAELERSRRS